MRITSYSEFMAFDLSLAAANELCALNGLRTPEAIRRLNRGEVNAVFEVTFPKRRSVMLKVGVRDDGPAELKQEQMVIQHLDRVGSVPVVDWITVNHTPEITPHPYAFMAKIGGEDGDVVWQSLAAVDKTRLAHTCGETLAALHATRLTDDLTAELGNPADPTAWAEGEVKAFHKAVETLRSQGWVREKFLETCERVWQERLGILQLRFSSSLLHYDFVPHNLRIDPDSLSVIGLLDWDNVCLGPALTDARGFELNVFFSAPKLRTAFWEGYGESPGSDERLRLNLHMLNRALQMFVAYQGPVKNYGTEEIEALARSL